MVVENATSTVRNTCGVLSFYVYSTLFVRSATNVQKELKQNRKMKMRYYSCMTTDTSKYVVSVQCLLQQGVTSALVSVNKVLE